jgi:hypothetical protein
MVKLILWFGILAVIIHLMIYSFRNASGKERWSAIKIAMYSGTISALAVVLMSIIVVIF